MSIVIAERGQQMIDLLKKQGNEAINASAIAFDANPRRFNSSRQPIDRTSVCLAAWSHFEWAICHVQTATEWLLEGNTLRKLERLCREGKEDYQVYNNAFYILHGKKRG
jgi:hypothetical protein